MGAGINGWTAAAASSITAQLYSNGVVGNGLGASSTDMLTIVDRGHMNLQAFNTTAGWYTSLYVGSNNGRGSTRRHELKSSEG